MFIKIRLNIKQIFSKMSAAEKREMFILLNSEFIKNKESGDLNPDELSTINNFLGI